MVVRVFGTRLAVEGDAQYKQKMRDAGRVGQDAMQRVGRSTVPANRGLRLVSAAGVELRQSMQGVASAVPAVGRLAGVLGPVGLGLGAAAAGAAVLAVKVKAAVGEVAAIGDAADRAGVTAEFFEQMSAAVTNSGQKVEGLESSLAKLNVRMGEASAGNKQVQETFAALGISAADLANLNTDEVVLKIADALASIEDPGQRAVLMQRLFEEGGRSLLPVLAQGSDKLREMFAEAEELGQLYGGDVIRNTQAVSAELARQSQIIEVQLNKALVDMGPLLQDAAEAWVVVAKGIAQAYAALKDFLTLSDQEALTKVQSGIGLMQTNLDEQRQRMFDPDASPLSRQRAEEQFQGFYSRLEQLRAAEREVQARIAATGATQTTAVTLADVGGGVAAPELGGGAGGGGKAKKEKAERDEFAEQVKRIRERTEALEFEVRTAGMAAEVIAYLTTVRELESAATADGTEVSREERQAILDLASAQSAATAQKERAADAARALSDAERDAQRRAEDLRDSLDEMSRTVGGSLGALITGTNTWRDALGQVLDVALRIADQQLQKSGLLGQAGGFVSSFIGGLFGGGFADGAAFRHGSVVPFAGGGIVTSPTMFPMSGGRTGLMGERGAEAIMPLVQTASGALGVRAEGAGQSALALYIGDGIQAEWLHRAAGQSVQIARAEAGQAVAGYDRHAAASSIRNAAHRQRA